MKNAIKQHQRLSKLILIIIGLVLIFTIGIHKVNLNVDSTLFSMEYVNTDELEELLSFGAYSSTDWNSYLSDQLHAQLTYGDLGLLLEKLQVTDFIDYEKKSGFRKVDRASWNDIYGQILDLLDTNQEITSTNLLVIDIAKNGENTTLQTQAGIYTYSGHEFSIEQYESYTFFCKGDSIIGIQMAYQDELTIPDVLVQNITDQTISYIYEHAEYKIPVETDEKIENTVCDLAITAGQISGIQKKTDEIQGNLITVNDSEIEIEGYGKVDRSLNLPVYQLFDDVTQKSLDDIVIGNMVVSYVVADKCVCAILLKEPAKLENIRVLLLNAEGGLYRENVTVIADAECTISTGTEDKIVKAGEQMDAAVTLGDSKDTLRITPAQGGRITFTDGAGAAIGQSYEGTMEVRKYNEGYIAVNVLPIEHYLYGVVCSEMSARFSLEALKAQAVCARSYAYIQLLKGDYAMYGAHIDDSTNYQVYNKLEQSELTTQAVEETKGQVMSYKDQIIEAYYFSTSYGHTGNYEAWGLDEATYGYLGGTWLRNTASDLDLSDEATFDAYIEKPDTDCYESDIKYFRWKAILDFKESSDALKSAMKARKEVKDENILYYEPDGTTVAESMDDFGNLVTIQEGKRNKCGVLESLNFIFEQGIVTVKSEYNMRVTLGSGMTSLQYQDGTTNAEATLLPSAYVNVIPTEDGNFTVFGGGYGHGLGMSQNAANLLAEQGRNYEEILNTFYKDITITNIYEGEK